ncbi:MAG: hypothetical protein ACR2KV_09890 [Solirubrobacteraceae bacterium]
MHDHPTRSDAATTATLIGGGFWVDSALTPARRTDIAPELRERLALHVLAIGRMHTPEDLAGGVMPARVLVAFEDPLERDEALAWVDLLLAIVAPPAAEVLPVSVDLSPDAIEAIARRVVELIDDRVDRPGLVDAAAVAEHFAVKPAWVYEHAEELGAIRLGDGRRARVRFSIEGAGRALAERTAARYVPPPVRPVKATKPKAQARPRDWPAAPLLPIGRQR